MRYTLCLYIYIYICMHARHPVMVQMDARIANSVAHIGGKHVHENWLGQRVSVFKTRVFAHLRCEARLEKQPPLPSALQATCICSLTPLLHPPLKGKEKRHAHHHRGKPSSLFHLKTRAEGVSIEGGRVPKPSY